MAYAPDVLSYRGPLTVHYFSVGRFRGVSEGVCTEVGKEGTRGDVGERVG
jgi:hypothetical protein